MKKKWISRREAAEILRVHPQTISNYAERGLLSSVRTLRRSKNNSPLYAFSREEVEALQSAPVKLHTIEEMERAIAEEYNYTAKRYNEAKREFLAIFGGHHNWGEYKRIIKAAVAIAEDGVLTEMTKDIIDKLLDGMPIKEIAEYYDLSTTRVHQIIFQGIRKIAEFPKRYTDREKKMAAELESLRKENLDLKTRLVLAEAVSNNPTAEANNIADEYYRFRNCPPYTLRLIDLGISVRTFNCCYAAEIKTIGDLCSYKRNAVAKIRNLGRKSLRELDILLEKNKVHWGMWHDPLRHEKDPYYD